MTGTARILLDGGMLLLPAHTPYEREIVLEHVRHCLLRDDQVCLEMNGRPCEVRRATKDGSEHCAACRCALARLACELGSRTLCVGCAYADTACAAPPSPRPSSEPLAG